MRARMKRGKGPSVARHFASLSSGPERRQNVYMFTQDVQLAVMPIGGRRSNGQTFAISLSGDAEQRDRALQLIGEISRYKKRDTKEVVCDAVNEVAQHLAWEGCAVYEIVRDDSGPERIFGFTSKRLWRFPGVFIQLIPRAEWALWKKKAVVIPARSIWHLEMPSELGGRRGYKRVLKNLGRFEHLGPPFWTEGLQQGIQPGHFDFQEYVRACEIYSARVTKVWGWNRRDWSQERCTEYFTFHKMLRFAWAQAMMRQHIIEELNGLLTRLGVASEVTVSGLPTTADILTTREELADGRISFREASDRVRI